MTASLPNSKDEKSVIRQAESVTPDLEKDGPSKNDQRHIKVDEKIPWRQSIRQNPKAIAWCCYMLFTCIMWGYDGLASAIVLSIPRFRQDYGHLWNGQYVVPAGWQLAFTAASMIGIMLGGIGTGIAMKHVG